MPCSVEIHRPSDVVVTVNAAGGRVRLSPQPPQEGDGHSPR